MTEETMLLAEERKLVYDTANVPMPYVRIAVASIILGAEWVRIYSQSGASIDAMRPSVRIGERQSMRDTFFQTELKAVIR